MTAPVSYTHLDVYKRQDDGVSFVYTEQKQKGAVYNVYAASDIVSADGTVDVYKRQGISYTEKEYNYAKTKGLPVLVLIKQPSAISESEKDTGNDKYATSKYVTANANAWRSRLPSVSGRP